MQSNQLFSKVLTWTPRVMGVLFAVFLSLFALDVFGEEYGFWGTVWALLMHLIPTLLVIIALILGWRWKRLGGAIFLLLGVAYILLSAGSALVWQAVFAISAPLLIIGLLFILDGVLPRPTA